MPVFAASQNAGKRRSARVAAIEAAGPLDDVAAHCLLLYRWMEPVETRQRRRSAHALMGREPDVFFAYVYRLVGTVSSLNPRRSLSEGQRRRSRSQTGSIPRKAVLTDWF